MTNSRSEIAETLQKIKKDLENSIPTNGVPNDFDTENPRDYAIYKFGQGNGILAATITISEYIDDICEDESVRHDDQCEGQISMEEFLNEQQGE